MGGKRLSRIILLYPLLGAVDSRAARRRGGFPSLHHQPRRISSTALTIYQTPMTKTFSSCVKVKNVTKGREMLLGFALGLMFPWTLSLLRSCYEILSMSTQRILRRLIDAQTGGITPLCLTFSSHQYARPLNCLDIQQCPSRRCAAAYSL